MVRRVLAWVRGLLATSDGSSSGESTRETDDEGDERGFLASRLDASVMFAHGADIQQVDTENDENLVETKEEVSALQEEASDHDTHHETRR